MTESRDPGAPRGLEPSSKAARGPGFVPHCCRAPVRRRRVSRIFAWRSCLTRLEEAFANQEFVERILEIARDSDAHPRRPQPVAAAGPS